jgi:hypothetical protein
MADDKAKAEAYNAAQGRLRDHHREEYRKLIEEEFTARGLIYHPRPTPFDRAKAQILAFVTEFGSDVLPSEEDRQSTLPMFDLEE